MMTEQITPKFRASWTVLSLWAAGNWQGAVEAYFKLPSFTSEAMADGKEFHDKWQRFIDKTKNMPPELGQLQFKDPKTELKLVVQLYDWLELVGKIDCYDDGTIYEFKTGIKESNAKSFYLQSCVYGVLALFSNMPANKSEIRHYNQHIKQKDISINWLTPAALKYAVQWVESVSSEIHAYFIQNNLYQKLGGQGGK